MRQLTDVENDWIGKINEAKAAGNEEISNLEEQRADV